MKLTPKNITEELNKYIVGQDEAKKAVAVALSNRERRRRLEPEIRREVMPKNIILIGPTGVGKTEIARRMAALVQAPFVKVEATKFTEVGYVGRDVDSIVVELVEATVSKVYEEKQREVEARAESLATERLVSYVCQQLAEAKKTVPSVTTTPKKRPDKQAVAVTGGRVRVGARSGKRARQIVASLVQNRELDDQLIEIEVSDDNPTYQDFALGPEDDYQRDDFLEVGDGGRLSTITDSAASEKATTARREWTACTFPLALETPMVSDRRSSPCGLSDGASMPCKFATTSFSTARACAITCLRVSASAIKGLFMASSRSS